MNNNISETNENTSSDSNTYNSSNITRNRAIYNIIPQTLRIRPLSNVDNVPDISQNIPIFITTIHQDMYSNDFNFANFTNFNNVSNLNENNENNENEENTNINNLYSDIFDRINSIIPSSSFIERIFNDYIQNSYKLTDTEYENNIIELNCSIDECPICFNYSDKSVQIKKCEHIFCESCIKNWLTKHKYTCPICRTKLKEESNNELEPELETELETELEPELELELEYEPELQNDDDVYNID